MKIHFWGVRGSFPVPGKSTQRYGGNTSYGEWIMHSAKISSAEYRGFARQFNPVKYNPAQWSQIAKDAGIRYIVITAKHHDGFALYPSDATDWDIADATPYKKDLLGPLVPAGHGRDHQGSPQGLAQQLSAQVQVVQRELGQTLVHEAYFKLFPRGGGGAFENRRHFFGAAARAMRQVVVDYARARLADCRGAGAEHIALDDLDASALPVAEQAERLVAIDAALGKLAALDPRLATVIEMRFFVGMEVEDLAELLQVSVPTIVRDTRTAKAFLQRELDLG